MKKAKKIVKDCFSIMLVAAMLILLLPIQAHAAQTTQTLRSTYGSTYGHVGTCINYSQLTNQSVLNHVKSQYNSITLENEMKPDSLLGEMQIKYLFHRQKVWDIIFRIITKNLLSRRLILIQ